MKIQLSLEMLTYMSLAFLSLGAIVGIVANWHGKIQYFEGEYNMYLLVQRINGAILSGNPNAYAALRGPQLCNLTFSSGFIETIYGNFSVIGNINKTYICGGPK